MLPKIAADMSIDFFSEYCFKSKVRIIPPIRISSKIPAFIETRRSHELGGSTRDRSKEYCPYMSDPTSWLNIMMK